LLQGLRSAINCRIENTSELSALRKQKRGSLPARLHARMWKLWLSCVRSHYLQAMPAEPRSTFFTSDTHFGDHRVLNIRRRPFSSVAEMNESLIAAWNARVGPTDEIWHLGDFASGHTLARAVLPRLNGRKHLITGNLDGSEVCALGWCSVLFDAEPESLARGCALPPARY